MAFVTYKNHGTLSPKSAAYELWEISQKGKPQDRAAAEKKLDQHMKQLDQNNIDLLKACENNIGVARVLLEAVTQKYRTGQDYQVELRNIIYQSLGK